MGDNLLNDICLTAVHRGASDIHLMAGSPPLFRVNCVLETLPDAAPEPLTNEQIEQMVRGVLPESGVESLVSRRDIDFGLGLPGVGRFRCNAHYQRNTLAMALRVIPERVRELSELNLPQSVALFAELPRGLVLVTGDTGCGKSTTLASLIDYMNTRYPYHIITLEDPIEYELVGQMCAIEQREIGCDALSFHEALRTVVRQDPDVILVGEMRDLETVSAAITAAETGHLVLSTLHTQSAAQTVERMIDTFPPGQQGQIRTQLANTLQGIVCQTLFTRRDVPGMIPAVEILTCTPAVRNCIRENRIFEIPNVIATSRQQGMVSLDTSIQHLLEARVISREDALARSVNPDRLKRSLQGVS